MAECQLCCAPGGYPYCNENCRHADQCTGDDTCPDCDTDEVRIARLITRIR